MTEVSASIEALQAICEKNKEECQNKSKEVEEIIDTILELNFNSDEEIVRWIKSAISEIKIKDVNESQT